MLLDEFIVKYTIDSSDVDKKLKALKRSFDEINESASKSTDEVKKSHQLEKQNQRVTNVQARKNNKELDKTNKGFTELKKNLREIKKISSPALGGIGSTLGKIGIGAGGALAAYTAISSFTRRQAQQYTPFFFNAPRFGTTPERLNTLSRAFSLTGAQGSGVFNALDLIGKTQTRNKYLGVEAGNPLNSLLYALGVPLARGGRAKRPEDVLLNIASALERNISQNRLTKQEAFNLCSWPCFKLTTIRSSLCFKKKMVEWIRQHQPNGWLLPSTTPIPVLTPQ